MAGSSEGSSFFEGMGGVCVCVWGRGGEGGGVDLIQSNINITLYNC